MSAGNAEMAGEVNFKFTVSGLAPDTFQVVDFAGEEELNADYSFRMTLLTRNTSLVPRDLLGKDASLVIESRREGPVVTMPYHGMIGEVEVCRQVFDRTEYKVTLVPRIARLALSEYSEVYTLEKDIPGLLEEVLKEAGFTSPFALLMWMLPFPGPFGPGVLLLQDLITAPPFCPEIQKSPFVIPE